jgi:hypothetical protein
VRIRYRGNVSTEPLPSKDGGIFTEKFSSNDARDIRTEFYKDWFRHSKVNRGDTQTQTAKRSHKPNSFLNKESRLIKTIELQCNIFSTTQHVSTLNAPSTGK